MKVNYSSEMYI